MRRPGDASAGTSDPSASAKNDATAAAATRDCRPQHEAGEEPDGRAQREVDEGVHAAGQRDAAARFGKAEDDEAHRHRAHEVRDGRGRPEDAGDRRGQAKDAAADREVDDARRHAPGAEGADERSLARARGPVDPRRSASFGIVGVARAKGRSSGERERGGAVASSRLHRRKAYNSRFAPHGAPPVVSPNHDAADIPRMSRTPTTSEFGLRRRRASGASRSCSAAAG